MTLRNKVLIAITKWCSGMHVQFCQMHVQCCLTL